MRTLWIRRLAGGAGLLAACWLAVSATEPVHAADPAAPDAVAAKAAEADIAFLQKELAGTPKKNAIPTLKAAALSVALYAQNSGKGGLQDQAVKVAEAIAKKDLASAKTAAEGLSKAAGGAAKPVKLYETAKVDVGEVMSVFRPSKTGGLNIEKDIRDQGKNVTDVKLVGTAATNTIWAGYFTLHLPNDKGGSNAANKKKWEGYTHDMTKLAGEIATEAGKGDKADKAVLSKKLKALDASCTACHNDFRD